MSIKKYLLLVFTGMTIGILSAFAIHRLSVSEQNTATRNVASAKLGKFDRRGAVGKPGAPILVQVTALPESDPERGFYRLLAHVTYNQPMANLRYQWAMPVDSRVVEGTSEGNLVVAEGEDYSEVVIDVQITDSNKDQQILFDVSYEQSGFPMGTSDLFVVRSNSL